MRSLAAVVALGAALSFTPFIHADSITGARTQQVQTKVHHMKGTVSSIDGDTVVVTSTNKNGDKKDHKVKTDSNTKFMLDGKEAKLTDLKAGQDVTITPGANKGDPAAEIDATSAK
jgi:D-lyxose ketol-isomerase